MIDPKLVAALTDAVRECERCSCAEVVVEVRSRSGSYAHAESRFAALFALAGLVVLLFSRWTFAPAWVVADVAIFYACGLWIARRSDALRRWTSLTREREAQVRTVASSLFFDRGIANTERETGVLVFLSLLERRIEVLADRGILAGVPALEWNRVSAPRSHANLETLLITLHELTPLLGQHLPVREGDRDELESAPRIDCD